MTQHIGVKLINAYPMTRLAYNDFRGWELPSDENGSDEGYLVEYLDGGKPNTDRFNVESERCVRQSLPTSGGA